MEAIKDDYSFSCFIEKERRVRWAGGVCEFSLQYSEMVIPRFRDSEKVKDASNIFVPR